MKKIIIPLLLIGIFMLVGCGSKNAALSSSKEDSSVNQSSSSNTSKTSAANTSSSTASEVNTQFKPVKPGTVPQLNQAEKSQVNNKLNSVINNLDGTLKSLDDANDINFN